MKTRAQRGRELAHALAELQVAAVKYVANRESSWTTQELASQAFNYVRAVDALAREKS